MLPQGLLYRPTLDAVECLSLHSRVHRFDPQSRPRAMTKGVKHKVQL